MDWIGLDLIVWLDLLECLVGFDYLVGSVTKYCKLNDSSTFSIVGLNNTVAESFGKVMLKMSPNLLLLFALEQ